MKIFYLLALPLICCTQKSSLDKKEEKAALFSPFSDEGRFDTTLSNNENTVIFQNDSIEIANFTFAPFDSTLIWTFSTNSDSYELNLLDSTWTDLKKRFGKYSRGLSLDAIFIDPYTQNIWVCNFHKGIYVYDPKRETGHEYERIHPVSSIKFSDNHVFIGTWDGLYTIDRKTKEALRGLTEINIRDIQKLSKNTLSINEKYEYDFKYDKILSTKYEREILQTKSIKDVQIIHYEMVDYETPNVFIKKDDKVKSFFIHSFNINNIIVENDMLWLINGDLRRGLIQYNFKDESINTIEKKNQRQFFWMVNDSQYIWFWNRKNLLILDKNNFDLKIISPPVSGDVHNIVILDDKVFLNTWHSIQVFRKDYLIQLGEDPNSSINSEKKFIAYLDSIGYYKEKTSFKQSYELYTQVKNLFEKSSNSRITDRIKHMKASLTAGLSDTNEILSLIDYMRDSIDDSEIQSSFYLNSITTQNYQGKVVLVLTLDTMLQSKFPGSRSEYHIQRMERTKKAHEQLQNIKNQDLNEDERLWKVGNIYYELFQLVGPEVEMSYIDMSYPFSYFDSLLNLYPSSSFTDDVEFAVLRHTEGSSHEGGDYSYNLEAIKLYEDLLKKNPSTNLRPNIIYELATLRRDAYTYTKNFSTSLQEALEYLDTLEKDYPYFYLEKNGEKARNEFNDLLRKNLWSLSIQSNKKEYKLGEDVEISFNLKNIDTKSKKISISKNASIPSFALSIEWYPFDPHDNRYNYVRIEKDPNVNMPRYRDSLISQNTSYCEEWIITKSARNSSSEPGYFRLVDEGKYKIKAYSKEGKDIASITSPEIWIEIKN